MQGVKGSATACACSDVDLYLSDLVLSQLAVDPE
jgi:hypothetical protein